MVKLKKLLPYIIIAILVAYVCMPLLQPGYYTMHDDEQIARLYDLDQSIKAGHIPPRFVPNLGFGYGYPFFNFYPPFAYYTGEVFHLLGFGYIDSMKLAVFSTFFASALFMYLFAKEFFGKWGGTLSAAAYTLLSYKAVDVYVRGAYAEFFAFISPPLIFLALYKIANEKRSWFLLWNTLAVFIFILSHNLIAFMSTPFIAAWIMYCLFLAKDRLRFMGEVSVSFLLGFGLSAYFFIPSYIERGQTLVNILTTELASYTIHFVCSYQLWDSMWGYGGSIASCYDGISFEVGKVQLIASLIIALFALWKFFQDKKERAKHMGVLLFFGMLCFTLFLMVKHSKPVWDAFFPLWYVQFPWRYLLFAGFFASFLTGGMVLLFRRDLFRAGVFILILVPLIFFSTGKFLPQRTFNATDADYINLKKIRWETSNLAYEYVPNGVKTIKSEINTTKLDLKESEIATTPAQVVSGELEVTGLEDRPHIKRFEVNAKTSGILQINTFSFPGWKVFINGKESAYRDSNKLKLLQIDLPQGRSLVTVKYIDTVPKMYGNVISVLSIIGLLVFVFYIRKNYGKKTS